MRSSIATTSSPVDWRKAANRVSASPMGQYYRKGGEAKTGRSIPAPAPVISPGPSFLQDSAPQRPFEVLTAMENADDHHFGPLHLKDYGCPPLEADSPQARTDIVLPRAAFGKGGERKTGGLDPVDIGPGDLQTGFLGNVAIEFEQIGFGARTEADLKPSHSYGPSPAG